MYGLPGRQRTGTEHCHMEDPAVFLESSFQQRLNHQGTRESAARATVDLYESFGRQRPLVVFVESPLQLVLMSPLFVKVVRSKQFLQTAAQLCGKDSKALADSWRQAWPEIWSAEAKQMLGRRLDESEQYSEAERGMGWDRIVRLDRRIRTPGVVHSGLFGSHGLEGLKEAIERKLGEEFNRLLNQSSAESWWMLRDQLDTAFGPRFKPGSLHHELDIFPGYVEEWSSRQWELIMALWRFRFEKGLNIKPSPNTRTPDPNTVYNYGYGKIDFNILLTTLANLNAAETNLINAMHVPLHALPGPELPRLENLIWPGWDASWIVAETYLLENFPDLFPEEQAKQIPLVSDFHKYVYAALLSDGLAFICDWPKIVRTDERIRLHSDSGPAVIFADSSCIYAWHGVQIYPDVIESPESITLQRIESEPNADRRRVMIERYGQARYLEDTAAVALHEDDTGVLYRLEMPGDEPLVMVKVRNATPEPDGSLKEYFLRVPPAVQTAREAVAWTFDLPSEEYSPRRET